MSVALKKPIEEFKGEDIAATMHTIGVNARAAARILATLSATEKNRAIAAMARAIRAATAPILAANREDVAETEKAGATAAFIDRLRLDEKRIAAMADGVDIVAALPDPVGPLISRSHRPHGIPIQPGPSPPSLI